MIEEYARIDDACAWATVGRTTFYRLVAAGEVRLIKVGSRSLVDMRSLRAMLARRPEAAVRPLRH